MENSAKILPLNPTSKPKVSKSIPLLKELKSINRKKLIKLRAKKISEDSYSLYLHLRHNGKQEYHFLKLYVHGKRSTLKQDKENLKLAIQLREKKESELFQNDYDFQLYNLNSKADFIEYFESVVNTKIKDDNTIDKSWKNTLKHLKIFSKNKTVSFRQVDEKFCEQFRDYLINALSQNTAHTYFAKLKTAFNTAIKDKIILRNPAQFLHISKEDSKREFLTLEELKKLKAALCYSEQTKRAFLFSCFTGLRISDIMKLTFNEIQDGFLSFRQKKTKTIERMKLGQSAREIIQMQKDEGRTNKVFDLVTDKQGLKHLDKWAKDAKIEKKVTWHVGRHTFATLNLTYGNDIYTTMKLLGHKDVRVTQIYAKLIDKKKDEAIDNLPVI